MGQRWHHEQPHPCLPQPAAPQACPAPKTAATPKEPAIGFTRAGALWSSLIAGFLILIVLLIFITQNTASTDFTFLGWHWSLPLGVAILLAAVVGGLITVAVGTARILAAAPRGQEAPRSARSGA